VCDKCAKTEAMVIGVSFSDQYELFYAITLNSYHYYQLLGVDITFHIGFCCLWPVAFREDCSLHLFMLACLLPSST
jgi:hypothetical protein